MMLAKKGTSVTKKKLFRLCSLLTSDSPFTDRKRISVGLSNDLSVGVTYRLASKKLLPESVSIHSAYAVIFFV